MMFPWFPDEHGAELAECSLPFGRSVPGNLTVCLPTVFNPAQKQKARASESRCTCFHVDAVGTASDKKQCDLPVQA
jgi:hypothetical protein